MNGKRGLGRIMSALLAASSFVGQASAASVRRPAGKVKVGKNVVKEKGKLRVDGRKRRGKAVNAYDSPLDDPRNWVDAALVVSNLGLGGAALHYRSKSSKDLVVLTEFLVLCSYDQEFTGLFRANNAKDLSDEMVSLCGFYSMDNQGAVTGSRPDDCGKKCYYVAHGIFGGPIYRSLSADIDICVDVALTSVLSRLGDMSGLLANSGITIGVLKGSDCNIENGKCVTSVNKHLRNTCDKFLSDSANIKGVGDAQKKENLAKAKARVARVFEGAKIFRKYLRSRFSGFAKDYKAVFCRSAPQPH